MNWLTTILSLYLLGLSLWPCADESRLPGGQEGVATVMAVNPASAGSSHPHQDQCTPFCTCSCCTASLAVTPSVRHALIPRTPVVQILRVRFASIPRHGVEPLAAIWQPPKHRV